MRFYKIIENNMITSVGSGSGGVEITEREYFNIMNIMQSGLERGFVIGVDGTKRLMTEEEMMAFESAEQMDEVIANSSFVLSDADLVDLVVNNYNIEINGETKPVSEAIGTEIELPVKVGFKWEVVLTGNTFSYQLVEDPGAIGTIDNPIYYYEGCPLINNAFYIKDGGMFVYMDGEFVSWEA